MLQKFKYFTLAILSGILISLAFPPFDFTLGIFVALIPMLYIEHRLFENKTKNIKIFGYAYLTFFTWNLVDCWWLYYAAKIEGLAFEVLANSLLFALMFLLFSLSKKHLPHKLWPVSFICLWLSLEFLHFQDWELSWPWLSLGNVFANQPYLIQWYEFTGVLGGTLWVLALNYMLFLCFLKYREHKVFNHQVFRLLLRADFYLLAPIVLSVGLYFSYVEEENPVQIVVAQPNIDPYSEKFRDMSPEQQIAKALQLSYSKLSTKTDYLLLPETAIQGQEWEEKLNDSRNINFLKSVVNKFPQLKIVSGIASYGLVFPKDTHELPVSYRKFYSDDQYYESYNAAIQIDSSSKYQLYHKSLLVMGAERVPFQKYFPSLAQLSMDFGGPAGTLGSQETRSVFTSPKNTKVAPIICYESIYSDYVTEYVRNGANLLFILTNDGWWDDTPGYKQHFAFARLRAIENRRSIARSANTGVSGFIDQKGNIIAQTEWWKDDALAGTLNANEKLTIFSQFPYLIGGIALIGLMSITIFYFYYRFQKKPSH